MFLLGYSIAFFFPSEKAILITRYSIAYLDYLKLDHKKIKGFTLHVRTIPLYGLIKHCTFFFEIKS